MRSVLRRIFQERNAHFIDHVGFIQVDALSGIWDDSDDEGDVSFTPPPPPSNIVPPSAPVKKVFKKQVTTSEPVLEPSSTLPVPPETEPTEVVQPPVPVKKVIKKKV